MIIFCNDGKTLINIPEYFRKIIAEERVLEKGSWRIDIYNGDGTIPSMYFATKEDALEALNRIYMALARGQQAVDLRNLGE